MHHDRHGFTVVELTVSLVVAALVMLTAHRLGSALLDAVGRSAENERAMARRENAARVLVAVFGSVQAGASAGDGFTGDSARMDFTTWHLDSQGLPARYHVTLSARDRALVLEGLDAPLTLADSIAAVRFEYLLGLGASSGWVRGWSSPVSAPLAVRLRVTRASHASVDTVLLLIGERG